MKKSVTPPFEVGGLDNLGPTAENSLMRCLAFSP